MLFTKEEYEARLKKTRSLMEQAGIELLLATHPANMNYLTGYDGWSFYVHQGVLLSLRQEEPIWFGRGMDGNGARLTTWLAGENIRPYRDDYVQSATKHPMQFLAEIIREKGWERSSIGLEMDQFYFTHRSYLELEKALPKARFKDANLLVARVRQIKSEREIELIKRAGKIAEKVMRTALDAVRVGERECDAVARISQAQISGTADYEGDYPAIVPLLMAGKATNTPHLTWSDRKFQNDEAVILELAGVYKHYHAPMARTLFLGKPTPWILETSRVVIGGLEQTLEFIKPGVTCEQVESRWREAIAGSKVVKESRLGYSFGLNYPPDWGEQTASMRPGDKTELKPNMTFHVIPGIWLEEMGFEVSQAIRVTERGCEGVYSFPRELTVK